MSEILKRSHKLMGADKVQTFHEKWESCGTREAVVPAVAFKVNFSY